MHALTYFRDGSIIWPTLSESFCRSLSRLARQPCACSPAIEPIPKRLGTAGIAPSSVEWRCGHVDVHSASHSASLARIFIHRAITKEVMYVGRKINSAFCLRGLIRPAAGQQCILGSQLCAGGRRVHDEYRRIRC